MVCIWYSGVVLLELTNINWPQNEAVATHIQPEHIKQTMSSSPMYERYHSDPNIKQLLRSGARPTFKMGLGVFLCWAVRGSHASMKEQRQRQGHMSIGSFYLYLDRDVEGGTKGGKETRRGLIKGWGEKRGESVANPSFPLSLCN